MSLPEKLSLVRMSGSPFLQSSTLLEPNRSTILASHVLLMPQQASATPKPWKQAQRKQWGVVVVGRPCCWWRPPSQATDYVRMSLKMCR